MSIIDISIPIQSGMIHWPEDPPVEITLPCSVDHGDFCTVRRLNMGSHTGTHVDAFSHFLPGADSLSEMPLDPYVGPCRVLAIEHPKHISREELEGLDWSDCHGEPLKRVLLKSDNCRREKPWHELPFDPDFVHLTPSAATFLVEKGIQLVGVDYLSVDGYHSDNVPVHRILLPARVYPLEGLNLRHVEPGDYELICLPLPIHNGDGAPARTILRPLSTG